MMKCPYCGHVNDWNQLDCQGCGAGIAHVRNRVGIGHQFGFFDAAPEAPILVGLTPVGAAERQEQRLTQPTIVSRHAYRIDLGQAPPGEPGPGEQPALSRWGLGYSAPGRLAALDFPTLELLAVVTDRQVYRPGIQGLRISQFVPVFKIVPGDLTPIDTPETRLAAMLAGRAVFPELAHIELFPVEGAVTRRVRLGDQAGTWHCRACFFHGHDVVAAQSDIQVA